MPWSEMDDYEGYSYSDVMGNEESTKALRLYANDIDRGVKRRPVMLSGPTGIGKSMAARLIAREHGWNVVEMNSSDYRDKESIDRLLLVASQARSIFGKKNLILLDEVDELAPRFDVGAVPAINKIVETSRNPVILIANRRWHSSIAFLRESVEHIEFKRLANDTVRNILEKYVRRNDLDVSKEMIDTVANRSRGDARSAINDITALNGAGAGAIDAIGLRDKSIEIFEALDKIFSSNTFAAPLIAIRDLDSKRGDTPEMLVNWLDENIPKRYTSPEDRAGAYGMLARATTFASRASRVQYYTYWRYMNVLMSSGVALAKRSYMDTTQRYTFPRKIKTLASTKGSRRTEDKIAETLQRTIHSGTRRIKEYEMGIMAGMARHAIGKGSKEEMEPVYDFFLAKLSLQKEDVDWLIGDWSATV